MAEKKTKPAMGRGINALIAKSAVESINRNTDEVSESDAGDSAKVPAQRPRVSPPAAPEVEIAIDLIDPNPNNPRQDFEQEALAELAESIRTYGLISPITVRKRGERYELVAGERRLRAAVLAGVRKLPVYLVATDDIKAREMALVENIQREDLNPLEVALGFQSLIEECKLTQEELAPRVGKKRVTITNYLRLLKLPISIQLLLRQRMITQGHARALLGLDSVDLQEELARRIVEEELSVRAVEAAVQQLNASASDSEAVEVQPVPGEAHGAVDEELAYVPQMQEELHSLLGWGAKLRPGSKGSGKVVITYRSEGERRELMEKLQRLK